MCVDRLCNIAWSWLVLMLVITLALAPEAHAQCERQSVQAEDPAPDDRFGSFISISGDYAAVGLTTDNTNGPNSGVVLLYQRDAMTNLWMKGQRIIPSDNQANDRFGNRVVLDGDALIAGAPGDDDLGTDAGAAYIYRREAVTNQWSLETKLHASDGEAQDGFGYAVALSNERAIVTASRAPLDEGGSAAYVFHRNSAGVWTENTILAHPPEAQGDLFGFAAAMDDDVALISARTNPFSPPVFERVYVYRYDARAEQWNLEQSLENPDPSKPPDTHFGTSIAIHGDTLVVGTPLMTPVGLRAHIFHYDRAQSRWIHEITLPASQSSVSAAWLSQWVDVHDNRIALGDICDISVPQQNGAVFLYERDPNSGQWLAIDIVRASDGAATGTDYGLAVALDADRLMVGAPAFPTSTPGGSNGPGSAYFIDLSGDDCNDTIVCDDIDIANGTSQDANANGIPDECEFVPGDATGDGHVNVDDLIAVILAWGACPPPPDVCSADVAPPPNGDDVVDVDDLVVVILNWSA